MEEQKIRFIKVKQIERISQLDRQRILDKNEDFMRENDVFINACLTNELELNIIEETVLFI